ncbi:SDR family NAD(P)-dependent oxidoreductase [Streptomyces werraensis]|uniref:SDR family NAD(P)-dependent oxidoreductase n=1 Tax=Streptomyces werraensis TaxID=68284 RepID=UPI003F4D9670
MSPPADPLHEDPRSPEVNDRGLVPFGLRTRSAGPHRTFRGGEPFVTGASSGMGLATARAFAEAGATVGLADIDEDAVNAAVRPGRGRGQRPVPRLRNGARPPGRRTRP